MTFTPELLVKTAEQSVSGMTLAALGITALLTDAGVKTANYTTAGDELIRMDASGGVHTVTLPTAPSNGTRVTVKKVDSSTNGVIVARGGTDVFNIAGGSTSLTLTPQFAAVTAQYSSGVWVVTSADPGAGVLYSGAAAGGDLSGTLPSPTVAKVNGTALSGLATGVLKNTTGTGVPSIAAAADIPTVAAGGTGPLSASDGSTTNARTPTAHAASHLGGSDSIFATTTPAALGTAALGTGTGVAREGHVHPTTGLLLAANNLSDLVSASSARGNLGLGGAAVLNVGTAAGTVAAGDDSRLTLVRSRFYQAGLSSTASGTLGTATNIAAANLSSANTMIRVDCDLLLDAITAGGNMNVQIKVNGTQIVGATVLISLTAGTTGLTALLSGRLFVEATGVGGSVTYQGLRISRTAAGATTTAIDSSTSVSVDLSGGLQVSLTCSMTSNAGNVMRARGMVEQAA